MTRLLLTLLPLALAACAAPEPNTTTTTAQADDTTCQVETQVGSIIPKKQCRTASQRAADRAAVDEMGQALKNHPGQSPMPTGK
ncbi:hypothetical protein ACG04R_17940 [Roseateles sp. BYS78W]|uniref:Secreted protein n=1 Tax=Pelomonas candidula TaxID=3299025 RepID=A0ABW7HFL4_9BURK